MDAFSVERCRSRVFDNRARKAGDLSQQLPVARYRDLGHAPPEKSIERFDMEGTRRPGHL